MISKCYALHNQKENGANVCTAKAYNAVCDEKKDRVLCGSKKESIMNLKKTNVAGKIPFCLVFMLLCANLYAQSGQTVRLTPDEAVLMAQRNNLSLESERTSLETKRRASNLSWNQFIPNVTVAGAFTRNNDIGDPTVVPGVGTFEQPQSFFAIPVSVSLNLSMAMLENMNRLRIDYQNGLISYDKANVQLERDVRKAYHNILLLQENIELLRVSFENVERQVQIAQANYNAGLAPELTLIQARVARENMRPAIEQAENGLRLYMAQFAMFLGLSYDTNFELIPNTESINFLELDITEMISRASAQKPDILELRQTIRMLQSARRLQFYSLFPALSISWGTTPTYGGSRLKDLTDLQPPAGNGSAWVNPTPGALTISLGVRLHSLIPFSTDYQSVKAFDDQIATANIGLAQLINGTEIEVYNIVLELDRTRTNAQAQAENVALAEQSYRLTEQAYQAGLQDYFQVQSTQQALHQARVQMLEQQFNYLNGLIDLEYAIGVPFGTLSQRSN